MWLLSTSMPHHDIAIKNPYHKQKHYNTVNNTNHTKNHLYNYFIFRVRAYIMVGLMPLMIQIKAVLKLVAS